MALVSPGVVLALLLVVSSSAIDVASSLATASEGTSGLADGILDWGNFK